ncbi:serine hydroxymethyltransferase [Archaeoglobus sulfaticallidus PM70-1]|uniref:Serine hydroxymethyltransferase n=1 Tax=Archaeoglobus sulfaticallidus PM70-1 TaxID=387631 RepID=N0BGD3_9EURY|nr:serine hydroxymethyltransferase [Archaeoglobus sulfaticallidus]AGK62043.1 serine hydroxymethyltransferase [Archaeoglobus sulfaticallidus PM70-1]
MGSQFESEKLLSRVEDIVRKHHEFFRNSLPMIASENLTSSFVRRYYTSDLGHRYAEGKVNERFYQGCAYIDEIEEMAIKLTKKLFDAEHANVQPISGVTANIAGFFALTNPGDLIMSLSVPCGGHISHDTISAAGIRGLDVIHYPFNNEEMEIDVDETRKLAMEKKPRLFVLGSSLILFPQPVKEISELASEISAKVMFDASHVLGLIAGKKFQDPLREGADIVTGSTHKTFFGPQRAIILSRKELADKVDKAVFPGVVSNHHLNTLAGYVVAVIEMLEFGKEYARDVVRNAKKLAESLYNYGFDVVGANRGFTESHQVAVDVSKIGGGEKVARELERINIVLNKNLLPWDSMEKTSNPSGIRLGVQELTRLGMKENEMEEIADIFYLKLMKDESDAKLRERVIELKSRFRTIKYTFEEEEAYEF